MKFHGSIAGIAAVAVEAPMLAWVCGLPAEVVQAGPLTQKPLIEGLRLKNGLGPSQ